HQAAGVWKGDCVASNAVTRTGMARNGITPKKIGILLLVGRAIHDSPMHAVFRESIRNCYGHIPSPANSSGNDREFVAIVVSIHVPSHTILAQVTGAADSLGFFLGLGKRRQEHGRQDGNDRDDNKEFYQRKRLKTKSDRDLRAPSDSTVTGRKHFGHSHTEPH